MPGIEGEILISNYCWQNNQGWIWDATEPIAWDEKYLKITEVRILTIKLPEAPNKNKTNSKMYDENILRNTKYVFLFTQTFRWATHFWLIKDKGGRCKELSII